MTILTLLAALWTYQCNTLVCDFDASPSTSTIKSAVWNFGDSTRTSSGVQVRHTYEKAGTYKVLLKVYDGAKYSQLTKTIVVYAQPVRVDTLRLPYAVHDTAWLPAKVDTVTLVRTAWLHDTAMVVIAAPPNIVHVDSLQSPYVWPVYRSEVIGHVKRRDGKYEAWTFTACPASMTPSAPMKLGFTCTTPAFKYSTRDSAVARVVNP